MDKKESFTWHQILHVHGLLPLLVVLDADGGQREEDWRAEGHSDADPAYDVGPVVLELGVLGQDLGPGFDEELDVGAFADLHLFVMLNSVPKSHAAGAQKAWKKNISLIKNGETPNKE